MQSKTMNCSLHPLATVALWQMKANLCHMWRDLHLRQGSRQGSPRAVEREYWQLNSKQRTRWKRTVMDYYKMTLHPKPAQILDPEVWRQPTFELMWAILHLRQGTRYGNPSSVLAQYRKLSDESKAQWVTMVEDYFKQQGSRQGSRQSLEGNNARGVLPEEMLADSKKACRTIIGDHGAKNPLQLCNLHPVIVSWLRIVLA